MELFDFSEFPTLTTERLILRELVEADAQDIFIFRSDAEVQKFNDVPMRDVAEAIAMIQHLAEGHQEKRRIIWAITLRGEDRVIGLCGYNYWNRYHGRASIGYDLARSYWGQGIGMEAVREMIRFGFERMSLNRIEAETIADNHASVNMLEKLGFEHEGTRRAYSWEDDGTYHDSVIYGLLVDEYFT